MPDHLLLCLKCRGAGHGIAACVADRHAWEFEWFFSSARSRMTIGTGRANEEKSPCSRCKELHLVQLIEMAPPWRSQMEFDDDFHEQSKYVRNLGKAGSVEFWADCGVCCCLWALTPPPSALTQEIFLVPDWTISRLSGELGAVTMETPEKSKYATSLLSVLRPSISSLGTRIAAHRGDALCLLQEHCSDQITLGGKRINADNIDADMVLDWVKACETRHDGSCLPVPTDALRGVRLIDVSTREIVTYPGRGCEYVAVSYVWGNIPQDRYQLGDSVDRLPKTLEDALSFTRKLGKNYAWIDSVCIEQSNEDDKVDQINRMWSIFQGAWITIIALSGTTADAGLPRLSRQEQHPQLSCRIDGKVLVGLMPTLSQQIWTSPWGQRAWTLQEGLLSARCLYISDHQIYYDCASMQCSESLDESKSWAHNLTPASNPTKEGFVTWMLRQAGAGALRVPLDWPSRRLEHWGEKLNLYSYRSMTYPVDAIRAFQGVLQRLETIYPKGFFWGLPVEDFDWALTWGSQRPAIRREGFPTWSWAGWQGPLFFGQPMDVKKTRRIPTALEIASVKSGRLENVFTCKGDKPLQPGSLSILILDDPVHQVTKQDIECHHAEICLFPRAEKDGHLFITAVCFNFSPDFSNPRTGTYASGQLETFAFSVQDTRCLLRIYSTDAYITGKWVGKEWVNQKRPEQDTFILLARDHVQGFILHKLLLINIDEVRGVAERITVVELLVPLDDLHVLEEFNLRRQQIVLA